MATNTVLGRGGGKANGTIVQERSTGDTLVTSFVDVFVDSGGEVGLSVATYTTSLNLTMTITDVHHGTDRWDYQCYSQKP